jgi:diguanylate cyclase (GGDEF)-like protein
MSDTGPTASGVRVTRGQRGGWLARLATVNRLSDPTKCLLVSGLTLPFMVGWVVRLSAIRANPETARYISRAFLPTMLAYQWAQLVGHVLIVACALVLRSRGRFRVRWLVHAEIQWWLACFAFSFYALGPFTSPFGVLLLVLPVAGSILFPARPMVYGFAMLGLYSVLMIGLERAGVIPYAPFLERPPFEDGRLVNSWIVSIGSPAIFAAALVLAAHSWIVAQWRLRERELEVLIGTDPLTGVANRRVFFERLDAELARSRRHGNALSLLMVDVDHFKSINDRHGHQVGDVVLADIATGLRDTLRTADVVARYGGEEFSIILPETGLEEATRAAERVRAAIAAYRFPVAAATVQVSVSVGVACMLSDEAADQLVFRADAALLDAKRSGRDRVTLAATAPDVAAAPAP